LQEHNFSEGALRIGGIMKGVEDLREMGVTFLRATICLSLRSTAFQTIP
jgi:hypothetical protein